MIGGEDQVLARLRELAAAGVTDFAPTEFTPTPTERRRTRALLKRAAAELA